MDTRGGYGYPTQDDIIRLTRTTDQCELFETYMAMGMYAAAAAATKKMQPPLCELNIRRAIAAYDDECTPPGDNVSTPPPGDNVSTPARKAGLALSLLITPESADQHTPAGCPLREGYAGWPFGCSAVSARLRSLVDCDVLAAVGRVAWMVSSTTPADGDKLAWIAYAGTAPVGLSADRRFDRIRTGLVLRELDPEIALAFCVDIAQTYYVAVYRDIAVMIATALGRRSSHQLRLPPIIV